MKIAIMQPYFMPYIGYFQLMAAVDKLILLDDVNYIKRGWINRNRLLCNGTPSWITIPLVGASQNIVIKDIEILPDNGWKRKLINQVTHSYSSAPFRDNALSIFEAWIQSANGNLSCFLYLTLKEMGKRFGIMTEVIASSSIFPKNDLFGADRILDICVQAGATHYINAPGGTALYQSDAFLNRGVTLDFLKPVIPEMPNGDSEEGMLSILHLLMYLSIDDLQKYLTKSS